MTDLTQHARETDEVRRARANPDLDYEGGSGGTQDPPPDPDHDMPGDPPPRADLDYEGGSGGTQDPPPDPDHDMPGDPPPPEVAEKNGR